MWHWVKHQGFRELPWRTRIWWSETRKWKKCWEQVQSISCPASWQPVWKASVLRLGCNGRSWSFSEALRSWHHDCSLVARCPPGNTTNHYNCCCELWKLKNMLLCRQVWDELHWANFVFKFCSSFNTNFVSIFDLMSLASVKNACKQGQVQVTQMKRDKMDKQRQSTE